MARPSDGPERRPGWLRPHRVALVLTVLGGLIGVSSAAWAVAQVGSEPVYRDRVGLGWLALVLACIAVGGGWLARTRPGLGSAMTVIGGLGGSVAINLFFINSAYVLALPFWLVGAGLALATRASGRRAAE